MKINEDKMIKYRVIKLKQKDNDVGYFYDGWNILEFFLVISYIFIIRMLNLVFAIICVQLFDAH